MMTSGPSTRTTLDPIAAIRWVFAAFVILAAHGGMAWLLLNLSPADAMQGAPPEAVIVDLAPVAAAQEVIPREVAPGPEAKEAQPEQQPDPVPEKPVVEEKAKPPEPIQKVELTPDPPPVAPAPAPEIPVPVLPEKEKAEAVIAPPPKPEPKKPPPKPVKKKEAERKKPIDPDQPKREQTTAPAASEAQKADRSASPSAGVALPSPAVQSSWKSELIAHLNRYKRYPAGANGNGVASVTFSINASGRVMAARLGGSAGESALDQEAVAIVNRASPMPAPPAGMGSLVTLSVPIRFSRSN